MAERIRVLAEPVFDPETLEDCNYGARVVIKPTGLFGLGRPFFCGTVAADEKVSPPLRVKVITQPTPMWYSNGDGPADKYIDGVQAEEVLVTPVRPQEDGEPIDLDS